MSKYNYVDLNSSKMLTNLNSLNIGIESDELFINNELNFTKNINVNSINNKNILLPRKPEIYDANKLVLTNSTYNDFEYLQFNNRIIQTQFTQYRTDFISSGTGWRELPFSVTITPKNIHSQILISTAVYYGGSNTSADFGFRLYKKVGSGSFTEIPLAQNLDNDNKGSGVFMSNNSGADNENDNYYQYQTACVTNEFLDYPRTTDTIKYKLYCSPDLSDSNNTDVFYINRPANSTSTDNDRLHSSSYIKAQELEIYKYTDYEAPIVTEYFMNNQLYKIFTFLKDGKLVLPKDTICDYLIVAGGGGGGSSTNSSSIEGGGGGAGGLIYRENISLATGTYNIKVGDGGDAETNGEDSYIESELVPLVGYGVADNNLNAYTSSFSSNPNNTYDNYIHDDGNIPIARFTSWVSGAYIEYDFGSNTSVRVIHYKIFSLGGNENAMPSSWTFQARNSTSDSWVILDTQTNITDWGDETRMHDKNINATNNKASSNPNCAKSYNVSNINKYRYYKIVFTANGGHGASLWINELALFGGSDSLFEGAKGGGGGSNIGNGNSGGSGSGGRHPDNSIGGNAISYNNGSVSTNQGYSQGINQVGIFGNQGGIENSSVNTGGGGGGAGAPGNNGGDSSNFGHGGIGKRYNIRDGKTAVYYAGGGGAGKTSLIGIRSGGGLGGGGDGAPYSYTPLTDANHGGNGKANTGGGGGGSYSTHTDAYRGGKGGSGIVIVRVPQNLKNTLNIPKATGGNISYYTSGNKKYHVHKFTYDSNAQNGIFNFTINSSNIICDILIVAGGGGGGSNDSNFPYLYGGGGGAGGLIYKENISLVTGTYNIKVGNGAYTTIDATINGEDSYIKNNVDKIIYASKGGGGGGTGYTSIIDEAGRVGGSGGGGAGTDDYTMSGGYLGDGGSRQNYYGNTESYTISQPISVINQIGEFGHNGGDGRDAEGGGFPGGGGGGGAGSAGDSSGAGGLGKQYNITGSLEYYAEGGASTGGPLYNNLPYGKGGDTTMPGEHGVVIVRFAEYLKNTLNIPKATGGNISYYTSGNVNYCVHTFLDSGSFIPESSLQVDYLIVAGGGSGGSGGDQANEGAGGGAGGLIYQTGITFTNSTYTITIGKGGSENSNGENSSITGSGLTSNRIALGGGKGGHSDYPFPYGGGPYNNQPDGNDGGSGGGGCHNLGSGGIADKTSGDTLIQMSTTPNEVGVFGNKGGDDVDDTHNTGGGGGGAGGPGQNGSLQIGTSNLSGSGFGGIGKQYSIRTGSLEYYAGGGGASSGDNVDAIGAPGGLGGGGKGGGGSKINQGTGNLIGEDGKPNTGGGGGGTLSGRSVKGGDGGSGIVVIRYQL